MLLLVFSVLIVASRSYSYRMPANVDVSLGQVIGHELLKGRSLYTEIWDHRPPFTYLGYALAELLAGWGPAQLLLLGAGLSILTMVAVWWAAGTAGRTAGLVAAGMWTIVQADLAMEAQHPNAEAFLNAAMLWGFALLVRGKPRWGPGILWATATLFKANAVVFPALFSAAHISTARDRLRAVRDVGVWLLIGAGAWLATMGWFAWQGRLSDFIDAVFRYPSYYKGSIAHNLLWAATPPNLLIPPLLAVAPAAFLALLVFVLRGPRLQREYLAAGSIAAFLAVALPGKFFGHYYQLYAPMLAVGAGWGTAAVLSRSRPVGMAISSTVLGLALIIQVPNYTVRGEAWVRRAFPGEGADRYLAEMAVLPTIRDLLSDGATFYQLGSEPGYYIRSGQIAADWRALFQPHMPGTMAPPGRCEPRPGAPHRHGTCRPEGEPAGAGRARQRLRERLPR